MSVFPPAPLHCSSGLYPLPLNYFLLFFFGLPAPISHTPVFTPVPPLLIFSSLHSKMTHLWINIKCVPATLPKNIAMHRKCLLQPLSPSAENLLLILIYAYHTCLGNGYVFCASDSAVKSKGTIIKNTFFLLLVIYCFLLVSSLFLGHHHFA